MNRVGEVWRWSVRDTYAVYVVTASSFYGPVAGWNHEVEFLDGVPKFAEKSIREVRLGSGNWERLS